MTSAVLTLLEGAEACVPSQLGFRPQSNHVKEIRQQLCVSLNACTCEARTKSMAAYIARLGCACCVSICLGGKVRLRQLYACLTHAEHSSMAAERLPASAIAHAVLPNSNGRRLQDVSIHLCPHASEHFKGLTPCFCSAGHRPWHATLQFSRQFNGMHVMSRWHALSHCVELCFPI